MTRRKKIALVAGAGLVLVAAAAYGFHVRALRLRFEEKVAAIAARGEPTTLADLVPPAVPDNENAATLYLATFAHPCFEADNEEASFWWRIRDGRPFSAKELAEARKAVERAREPLALIREAARLKAWRFPSSS